MAFGVKVKLDVEVVGGSQLRTQIQQAVEKATQGDPIKIKRVSVELGGQESQRIARQLEGAISAQNITIKIAKIDASKPVAELKKQLTTMLGGLSITGLRDFVGTDGVASSYDKAAAAANKLAEAQNNARRRTEETNAALKELRAAQSTLNAAFKSTSGVENSAKLQEYLNTYHKLIAESEAAKNMQGEAQAAEVSRISAAVIALKQEVGAQLEAEKAAKKKASTVKSAAEIAAHEAAERERAAKQEANLSRQAIQLRQKINSWIQNNSKAYAANKGEIDSLLMTLKSESSVSGAALAQLRQRFEEISVSAREGGIAGKSFFDVLKAGWAKFGGWSIVTKTMMLAVNGVKLMIRNVVELDSAMTELKKVTDLTDQSYNAFVKRAAQTARAVGASVADTVNATADFARLGYNLEESASLAEAALIYKNVGDGIDDISIATESLISTLKAFDIEASNAMSVVDMFNEVGNNFAISSSGIGDALQRSASALATAGNSIEESIGLVTAMNSVVQDPDAVGTALKTLTMYLRAAKTEAEEAGVETDGMAESVSKLREEMRSLTGVDIMIDDDTFKSTYQIIKEISLVWNDLTDVTRANVLNLMGGKRNANVVTALIENFKDAESAMNSAMNSLGSATAENEKYLDSINGKIAKIKATFEELSSDIINSGIVKTVLDIANSFMTVVNVLSKLKLLLPAITASVLAIRGAMNGMKAKNAAQTVLLAFTQAAGMQNENEASSLVYGALRTALSGLTKSQQALTIQQLQGTVAASGMNETLQKQATAALTAAASAKTLSGAGQGLSAAVKGVGAAFSKLNRILLAIEVVISAVSFGISKHKEHIQETIDKANELSDAYSEAQDNYASNTKALESLREEFDALSAGVDENGNNVSLTSKEYDRYLSIIDQLIQISPGIVSGYDAQGKAILNYKTALTDAIAEQDKYIQNQRNIYLDSGETLFDGKALAYEQWQKELGKQGEKIGKALVGGFADSLDADRTLAWRGALEQLGLNFDIYKSWGTAYDQLMGMYEKADQFITLLRNSGKYEEDELTKIKAAISGVAGAYTQLTSIEAGQIDYLMTAYSNEDWFNAIPVGAMDEFRAGLTLVNDPLRSYSENMLAASLYGQQFSQAVNSDAAKSLTEMALGLRDGTTDINEYNAAVAGLSATLEAAGYGEVAGMVVAYFANIATYAQSGADSLDEYSGSVYQLSDALGTLSKGYDVLEKAQTEMQGGGGLSADTISAVASMLTDEEKITDYLIYENGIIKLNEQAWKDRSMAMIDNNIAVITAQIDELTAGIAELSQTPEDAWANSEEIEKDTEAIGELNKELELYNAIRQEAANGSANPLESTDVSTVSKSLDSLGNASRLRGYTQMTAQDYQSLIALDKRYADAIEYQNGIMMVNAEKHDEITAKILEETRAAAMHEKELILMSEEYQNLRRAFDSGLLTNTDDLQHLQDLEVQIQGYDVLANEIDNATSAYYRWLNRKTDDGTDRYSQAQKAFELINSTLYDEESDYYGRIGREEFGQAVDFVIGEHIELNTPEFDRAIELAKRYLTEGAEGAGNFYDDLVGKELLDTTTGVLDASIAEISEALGVSEEMVRTMIDRLNEYQEEAGKIKVTEPEIEVETAAEGTENALDGVITSLESAQEYISSISETPLVIAIQDEEATATGLTTVKDMLDSIKTALIDITSNPGEFDAEELAASAESISGYISDIQSAIDLINGLDLSLGTEGEAEKLDLLNASANVLESSLIAISGTLATIIASKNTVNKSGINIKTGNTSTLLGGVSSTLTSIINKLGQIKSNSNVTIRINEVTTKTTLFSSLFGKSKVSGNASAMGTAMASGGKTLVGELGMETVVDPATNTWYTVGEHGAEFVQLPENAIVFNHKQTRDLFGTGETNSRGTALAQGSAALSLSSIASGIKSFVSGVTSAAKAVTSKVSTSTKTASDSVKSSGTQRPGSTSSSSSSSKTSSGSSSKTSSGSSSSKSSSGSSSKKSSGSSSKSSSGSSTSLEKLQEQYEELNKQTEHLIAHQEFLYQQATRGLDYSGMEESLQAQSELYKKIMSDSQAAVSAMIAAGATDTSKELQEMESAYWDAYGKLNDTLDKINALYVDALNEKIDGIQTAFENLKTAADEFNDGGITVDTFQSLIENGAQYMSMLDNINGQYVINTEGVQRMVAAQKEQLAIESALSYLQKVKTALTDGDTSAVAALVDMTEALSSSTWNAVYAQAALLRGTGGLTEEQYARIISNIDALRAIAAAVNTDMSAAQNSSEAQSQSREAQISALETILNLTEDLIKAEAGERMDAIKEEINAYKKIIDLKKESLRATKDENDYAKNVAEKTAEIAKTQARIDQLKLDDSRTARAERAKLEEDLADMQEALGDLQADHSYDLQIEALDRSAQDFEDAREQDISAIESSISSAEKLYQAAIARLESGWDTLYDELIEWNTELGSSLNSEITESWLKAAEAVKQYGSYAQAVGKLKPATDETGALVPNNTVAMGAPTEIPAVPVVTPTSEDTSVPEQTTVQKVQVTSGGWYVRTGPGSSKKALGTVHSGDELEYRGEKSGSWYAVVYKGQDAWISTQGTKLVEVPKYHEGGVAGGNGTLKDNEVLSVLEDGELILTEKMKRAAYKLIDFKDYLEKKLGNMIGTVTAPLPQMPALAGAGMIGNGGVDIGQMNFNPTIQIEINHSGTMTDGDARRYGKTIADTAMDELYDSFRRRGIGKIFGAKPAQ